jgi:hypothetical protein
MAETTEKKILRVNQEEVVVTRSVPMTTETCNKLRAIKAKFEADNNCEITFPVAIQMMTDAYFKNFFVGDKQ